jgi:hypothetical protein
MSRILDHLPALYRNLLPPALSAEVPPERKATCDNCSMCPNSCDNLAEPSSVERLFNADTKCCTFYPRLPNYLVGAILSDSDPAMAEGRRRITERIASRVGVVPQWLRPPAKYDLLYQSARGAFGRSIALRCPYYAEEGGSCTIWPYREAVCSTYFCKYVAGADGQKMWTAIKIYLSMIERQLSRWALLQISPDLLYEAPNFDEPVRGTGTLNLQDLDESPLADYSAYWQDFEGHETSLYRSCYEAVRGLSAADVERLLGLDGTVQLNALERRYEAAQEPRLPSQPRLNPSAIIKHLPDGTIGVGAYSEFDALALPKEALPMLMEFRGNEEVEEVRRRLRDTTGNDFDEDLLILLHQHRVLI